MKIETLEKKMKKAGFETKLTDYINKDGLQIKALFIIHNYDGLYPTKAVFSKHDEITKLAKRNGFYSEERGHYSSTLIY